MAETDDDKKPAPTEDQIKEANAAEEARWQGDFKEEDLTIPYKREEADENKKTPDPKTPKKTEDGKSDDAATDKAVDEEPTDEYIEADPVPTVEDPGDYQPADYSFDVTLKDGKTVKVSTPEEAEKIADDPDNFETPKQLMDFINKQNKMNRNLERDYEKWESQKSSFTTALEEETKRRETVGTFTNEISYLVDTGKLPDIPDAAVKQRWMTDETASQDAEFIKNPGVKEQIALLTYFVKENERRSKAKVAPLTSMIDAYNAWQLDSVQKEEAAKQKAEAEAEKAAGEARKTASSRVAGVSSSEAGAYVPKGIAVGNPNVFRRGAAQWDD